MTAKKALILVDLQNDFCTGGGLAVPEGEVVIPLANQLQAHFDLVIATQDWHPKEHVCFASNHPGRQVGEVMKMDEVMQVLWPNHCIQGTTGAAFHPQLRTEKIKKIIQKGTDTHIDSYSAFFDNAHQRSTGLEAYLRQENVDTVYIMGLATDYCVKYSALDAAQLGFHVFVIEDACRGVELQRGDVANAIAEMRTAGVMFIQAREILKAE